VPVSALPLNERRKRHVPSARDIVEEAVFRKFAEKGNIATAYAKLAAINPEKYGEFVRDQAKTNPRVQRARNRVGSDVSTGWPPTPDELLVLENFYATEIFRRPLFGMAYDLAAQMLGEKSATMTVDRYRRILRKFFFLVQKSALTAQRSNATSALKMEADSQTTSGTQRRQHAEGLLTKFDISSRLRISTRSVDEWMRRGRIPYIKIGGKTVRFRWDDVLEKLSA
jgi:hypothetical protein